MLVYLLGVLAAHIIFGITGFGAGVLSMPLAALALGVAPARFALSVVSFASGAMMVALYHRDINRRELARISLLALPGLAIGMAAYQLSPAAWLLPAYGAVVAGIGAWYLAGGRRDAGPLPKGAAALVLLAGGIVQGVFVSGGPLLVIYAATVIRDKGEFRATLSAVWAVLNAIVLAEALAAGAPAAGVVPAVAGCAPMAVGILLGGRISRHIDQALFLKLTYALLIVSGLSLVVNAFI